MKKKLFIKILLFLSVSSVLTVHAQNEPWTDNNSFNQGSLKIPNKSALRLRCLPSMNTLECELHRRWNQWRVSQKLKPLAAQKNCFMMAKSHSQHLARVQNKNVKGKVRLHHDLLSERAKKFSLSSQRVVELSVSGYYKNADDVLKGFLQSPAHRKNLLDPRLNSYGVGMAKDSSGRQFWTQCLLGS